MGTQGREYCVKNLKMKLVSVQVFGVRLKFLCLISKLSRNCIHRVIMLQLINIC